MSIRVLVVDDSAFARKVLRETLARHDGIEVVDIARDGAEALEKIADLRPDVITLDLVMPNVDGIGVLRALPPVGAPRVVVVSVSGAHTELGIQALELGAITVVEKPTALATDRLYEIGRTLTRAVLEAAEAMPRPLRPPPPVVATRAPGSSRSGVIVIGASTGGPPALSRLLAALPSDLRLPVAVVVHLPAEYTEAFARRLDALSPLRVREASSGLALAAGEVVIARGGLHLGLRRHGSDVVVDLDADGDQPPREGAHRPSVDMLFASAAAVYGPDVLGVVLTGMGNDGEAGARAVVAAGGAVVTETEASCVVYGMPRCVVEAGLSSGQAAIEDMASLILQRIERT
jgi:two-component system, chemotaxis family, protein-glutamate methylesterase/glutaminase